MNPPQPTPDEIRRAAARWTIRRDRGLSAAESIDYELWLAADPRHAAAVQRASGAWALLDRIPEDAAAPVLAAVTRRRSFWRRTVAIASLAAAAALVFGVFVWTRPTPVTPPAAVVALSAPDAPRLHTLADGTVVQLNTGGLVVEQFAAAERRVLLVRGEAHFAVTKNPARPFVVHAGNVDVRAVGTAFNVNLGSAAVDVLVTEGVVQLGRPPATVGTAAPAAELPRVAANSRAVVALAPAAAAAPVVVTAASDVEIARDLAWRAPLLRLGGATLAELVLEFQRRSGQRVILADPALASLRVGGRFRADDLAGFTHLLATTLELEVERTADGTLVLRKKNSETR